MLRAMLIAGVFVIAPVVVTAQLPDPCTSTVTFHGSVPECYFACPQGDTDWFAASGFSLTLQMRDAAGLPITNIPASDFWLIACDWTDLTLCAGAASSNADSATNVQGMTTMSATTLAVGGCTGGLAPVCQGIILQQSPECTPYCFDIRVRSCDRNGDLVLNLVDMSIFALDYPPNTYEPCSDFDCSGAVNIVDLANFAGHFGPPGDECN